ncbi:MAG: hypothetical protein Kow00129_11580 [Thermoleophilia bacterium]
MSEKKSGLGRMPAKGFAPTYGALYDDRRHSEDGGKPDYRHHKLQAKNPVPFVNLHVHSNFSFLDGAARIGELVDRAAELGQPALALTDHDGLYGCVRFARACAKRGVKPVFGAELGCRPLICADSGPTRSPAEPSAPQGRHPYHLVLLAETREGYANLCRLISEAHLANPERNHPPLVDRVLLQKYREGLICLTGCREGELGRLIDEGRAEEARRLIEALRSVFGDDHLFIELTYFGYEPHREARPGSDGAPVYQKRPDEYGRLRHRALEPGEAGHPATRPEPAAPGPRSPRDPGAYRRRPSPSSSYTDAIGIAKHKKRISKSDIRPDLPAGHPQRLNPADYDAGFHEDGTAWRLSCVSYCDRLLHLARETGIRAVLTTDAHYARPEDRKLHLTVRAAGRDQPLSGYPEPAPGVRCLRSGDELERELAALFSLHIDKYATELAESTPSPPLLPLSPLETPIVIAERCEVDLELGRYHFPQVPIPPGETAYSLLAKRCFRGIERRYRPVPPRAVELLEHELAMIERMGFAHYFLVVHDIVRWARAQGIAASGRGSAGNSLVCHVLDITASEPIRHNLLFERFLNPNRREMPDIDIDFCSARRDEVVKHIYRTFGDQNVAVVANVNTASPRSAVRLVAEALGFAPVEINALAKNVPRHGDAAKIRDYLAGEWPELRDSLLQNEERYGPLLDLVERLDAFPLHLGTHLGGFVIADRPVTYYTPLQWAAKGVAVTQFNKDDVADLGLVKMDILGLKTHSAVMETVHLIRRRTGHKIDPYELAQNAETARDPAAYEIISNGGSIGLFQLESAGQRNPATRLRESNFEDIIAAIALYRPGPLEAEMITPFIARRWGHAPVELPHPAMAEALGDTYGVILYQEQVLKVAQLVAGFSPAEADSLRRAMTRDKSREEMARIGATFVHHAIQNGVPEQAAREIFRQLEGFAAYGFNKSHSVCFAVISYATAYLKAHYPAEFLCAVLNNQPMGFYTPRTVLNDARRFGLDVRPLDVNLSGRGFTVEDEKAPDPWTTAGDGVYDGACDPFAQAWTAARGWGLTSEDLAELEAVHGEADVGGKNDPFGPQACLPPPGAPAPGAGRALRVGFAQVKHMSERALETIEQERRHAPFESFEDFYLRTRVEYPIVENLIRLGAFDSLDPDRTELLWRLPLLHDRLQALAAGGGRRGQLRAFTAPLQETGLKKAWTAEDRVRAELELLGLTVTCHPLEFYEGELRRLGVRMSYELPELGDEVPVKVAGVYERAQNPWMRSGRRTMFLTLEDAYGLFECVVFESKLARYAPVVARATYFLVKGRLQNNRRRGLAVVADEIHDLEKVLACLDRESGRPPGAGNSRAIPKKVG